MEVLCCALLSWNGRGQCRKIGKVSWKLLESDYINPIVQTADAPEKGTSDGLLESAPLVGT